MPPQASSADETDLSQEILSLLSQDAPGCVSYLHSFPENPAHPESSSSSDLPYMHLILIGSAHILLPVSFPARRQYPGSASHSLFFFYILQSQGPRQSKTSRSHLRHNQLCSL